MGSVFRSKYLFFRYRDKSLVYTALQAWRHLFRSCTGVEQVSSGLFQMEATAQMGLVDFDDSSFEAAS
eukprot:4955372-Amphidinium_carterae.2